MWAPCAFRTQEGVVVTLVNTNGMSFFGPGSEWFWSFLQFVVVGISLLGVYRQLALARSAKAFDDVNKLSKEWSSERMSRNRLAIYLALRDGTKPDALPPGPASYVADYWEGLAGLVRAGHVDITVVRDFLGSSCRQWWAALAPFTRAARLRYDDQSIGEHHEWLARTIADMDRKAGLTHSTHLYDESPSAAELSGRIERQQSDIRMAEELRAVMFRPMPPDQAPDPRPDRQSEA
jgi:hypothetical protein